jgi:hypothetical protein
MLIKNIDISYNDYIKFLEWISEELLKLYVVPSDYLYEDEKQKKYEQYLEIYYKRFKKKNNL